MLRTRPPSLVTHEAFWIYSTTGSLWGSKYIKYSSIVETRFATPVAVITVVSRR